MMTPAFWYSISERCIQAYEEENTRYVTQPEAELECRQKAGPEFSHGRLAFLNSKDIHDKLEWALKGTDHLQP